MKRIAYFAMAAVAILSACSNEITDNTAIGHELEFVPNFTPMATRAVDQGKVGFVGEDFWVWVDKHDETAPHTYTSAGINAWRLVLAPSLNTFNRSVSHSFLSGSVLNCYALHGNITSVANGTTSTLTGENTTFNGAAPDANGANGVTSTTSFTHEVESDQTTQANFVVSDLIYAQTTGVPESLGAAPLHFYHMCSKIEVCIKGDRGLGDDPNATLRFYNAQLTLKVPNGAVTFKPQKLQGTANATGTTVDFTPSTTAVTNATYDAVKSGWLTPTGGAKTIKMETKYNDTANSVDGSGNEVYDAFQNPANFVYSAAIIPSQTIAADYEFINVTWDGTTATYKIPTGGFTFEPGKRYIYNLYIDKKGNTYSFNPTVTPWVDDMYDNGDGNGSVNYRIVDCQ